MQQPHFIFGYLPFWIVNYGLAIVVWSCVGRFLFGFFAAVQPRNYIWRGFLFLTGWAVGGTRFITPAAVPEFLLPLAAAVWVFLLRIVVFGLMWQAGMTPRLAPA